MLHRTLALSFLLALALAPATHSARQQPAASVPDEVIQRIKDEGMNRSQVMETLCIMTDVIGPRLTNSPQMKRANEWTRDRLAAWGLQSAHLHAWGPFGRGWTLQRFSIQVVEPQCIPLIAYPKAWSPGTEGVQTGEVVYLDAKAEADLEKYRGKLKGAIVLTSAPRDLAAHWEPEARRRTEADLLELANAAPGGSGRRPGGRRFQQSPEQRAQAALAAKKAQLAMAEGAAALLEPGRGDGGNLFVQSASVPQPPGQEEQPRPGGRRVSAWDRDAPEILPQVVVAAEHYNRLVRMLQQRERLKLALDLQVRFHDQDLMGYNTIAEIPGSDLKDEIVMLGGHLDSWHAATGATDNGAGCVVTMEAVRILQALKLQPRRTIRIALWSGEEQGLLGSRAYVNEHFGRLDRGENARLETRPGYEKLSAYYNLDNGTGKIRGIYMQGNEAVRPLFQRWLAPFRDMGAATLTIANTGSTDHVSFDGIGLPGFQFIQDPIEYSSRTHHSSMDVFERAQADDLKQASVVMAAFVYQTAMLDQKLPRKPAPGAR